MHPDPVLEDELHLLKISVDRSSDEVFWLDFEGNILYVNDAASLITGYTREELCAMKIADLDPDLPPCAWGAMTADLRERETQFITSRHRCKNGTLIDVEILAVYVNYGDREFSFAYVRDITERKQAEALLRETDRKYHLLADNVHDVIWTTVRNMQFSYFSPSVTDLLGLTPDEAVAGTFQDLLTPDSYRKLIEDREQGLAGLKKGVPVSRNIVMELEFRRRDGSTVWTDMSISPVFDENGMSTGAVGIIRDITQRREMEKTLRESQVKLRTVLDNLPDLILVHRNGLILYANPPMIDNMGISPESVLNTSVLDYIPTRYHARVAAVIRERMVTGRHEPYEIEIESPVKGHLFVLIRGSVIEFDGSPATLAVLTDITEQKRAQAALRASEEKFRSYVENANDIIYTLTPDGIFTYVSPKLSEALGYDPGDFVGKSFDCFIHPDDLPACHEFVRQVFASGGTKSGIEYRIRHRDSTWRWHTTTASLLRDGAGAIVSYLGICRDVTERKQVEEALRKSRQQLEDAMDIASLVNWEYDIATGLFTFDDRFYALYGTTAEREGGMQMSPQTYAREFVHPDDQHLMFGELQKLLKTIDPRYLSRIEHRIIRRDGTIRYISVNVRVILDEQGRMVRTYGANQDITEQKKTEEALRKANRQLSLLTGITRHDIRNQLLVLKGNLDFSKNTLHDAAKTMEFILREERAVAAIERQIAFTQEYEDLGQHTPTWQNVDALVTQAQSILPVRNIRFESGVNDVEVHADPLFEKVFYNLIDNALRYGGPAMTTIRISAQASGEDLVIVFEDDGAGVAAKDKPHLFERGFGQNTGLGLFLSREILALTGITIAETGSAGTGARFEIRVPKGEYRIMKK
jgi:PAS domain S-box-containing protein